MRTLFRFAIALALLASGCGGTSLTPPSTLDAGDDSSEVVGATDAGPGAALDCTTIGCARSITLRGLATLSGAEMRAVTVHLCRNGTCVMGSPAGLPEQPLTGVGCRLANDADAECTVWNVAPDRYRLDASFGDWSGARDGDTFVVRVSQPSSGVVLAEANESVRYTTTTPNGPRCGHVCHAATLAVTTRPAPGSAADACAMNRCDVAPLVALGATVRLDTCGCARGSAGLCGGANPRAFFRVDAPVGTPLHFTTGTAQITVWDHCGDPFPVQCGGLSGDFVTMRNETRLYGVERFTACGEVAVTVTR